LHVAVPIDPGQSKALRWSWINTGMTHAPRIPPKHDPNGPRWVVEFQNFSIRTAAAKQAIDSIKPGVLAGVLEIWLKVVAPDSRLVGPEDCREKFVIFSRRSDLRRFIKSFGGRAATALPPKFMPPQRPK
jgi:hypothetical protein